SAARRFQMSRLRRNSRARRTGVLLNSVAIMARPLVHGAPIQPDLILPGDAEDSSLALHLQAQLEQLQGPVTPPPDDSPSPGTAQQAAAAPPPFQAGEDPPPDGQPPAGAAAPAANATPGPPPKKASRARR